MRAALPFQQFQYAFGRHLRDPRRHARPAGVPARRAGIYAELLFNNLTGFLDACYPVTRAVLGARRWRRLQREFFRAARCRTPWFREIAREFLAWLNAADGIALPPWLRELAHYEWVELALDVMDADRPPHAPRGDLLNGVPALAPALMNLVYAWPVQRIGPEYRPRKPRRTHLLVFRDETGAGGAVRFVELNPVSARLVDLLGAGGRTGRDACLQVAREIAHPDPAAVVAHGAALLEQLRAAGAILGVRQ
jgi:hypothetical protein